MVVGSHLEARSVTTHKPVSWLSDSSHFPGRRTARRTRARNVPLTEAPLDSAPRSAITGTANLETGGGGVGVDGGGGGGARPMLKGSSDIVLKRPCTDTEPSNNYVTSHLTLPSSCYTHVHESLVPARLTVGGRRKRRFTETRFDLREIDIKGEGRGKRFRAFSVNFKHLYFKICRRDKLL